MDYSSMQSQLHFNRVTLAHAHEYKAMCKEDRTHFTDDVEARLHAHKQVIYITKVIAKLEKLQKVLKADMQRELAFQRANRAMQAMRESLMGAAGEVYE